mmetsp:Transcript_16709/g.34953  ORF Transcript_16709/g.34953 Transcript_16709/m.34953 type:complete len:82 (-) Transcript_16709:1234-1479(-)
MQLPMKQIPKLKLPLTLALEQNPPLEEGHMQFGDCPTQHVTQKARLELSLPSACNQYQPVSEMLLMRGFSQSEIRWYILVC